MTDDERAAFMKRYNELAHAIQTGIGFLLHHQPSMGEPKHLRTGINLDRADQGSLVGLLVAKGIITEAEINAAILAGLEKEKAMLTDELEQTYGTGTKVTLV